MAIPNKSPLKILEKMEGGHIQELSNFWVPPIISGTGKAMAIWRVHLQVYRANPNKSP